MAGHRQYTILSTERMVMMDTIYIALLAGVILLAAILYSSVGHGGASAYLAAMALFGVPPSVMKPTALILNAFVSGIGTFSYLRAGAFSWSVFWPFAVGSIPLALLASTLKINHLIYKIILGLILIFTGCWLCFHKKKTKAPVRKGSPFLQILLGAVIGFVAGLTGIGGGVLLSPLLILAHWAKPRQTSGIAAAFILVNSVVAIIGHLSTFKMPPSYIWFWVAAAVVGGIIGSYYRSKRLTGSGIKKVLAVILLCAGGQLVGMSVYKLIKKELTPALESLLMLEAPRVFW